jgi:septum site-determining protein MinC
LLTTSSNAAARFEATVSTIKKSTMRLIGRSYMAFAFTPEAPIVDWLVELDAWLARTPGFFVDRAAVLDLTKVKLSKSGIAHLTTSLAERGVRVMGLEGVDSSQLGPELPPLLQGGRSAQTTAETITKPSLPAEPAAAVPPRPTSLLVDRPVRSGQSVFFPDGDVSVLGSVASGAEVVAGGSIHIYGTLRGRAMAGNTGNPNARIFCQKVEAELLAIDGYYRTAEEIDATLRGRAMHAWLDGTTLMITALH